LIGSLFCLPYPVGLPDYQSSQAVGNEQSPLTIGATIFTDIGALLVLAILRDAINAGTSPPQLGWSVRCIYSAELSYLL